MKRIFIFSLYIVSFVPCFSTELLSESRFAKLEKQLQIVTTELAELKKQCEARTKTCTRECSEDIQRGKL